MQSGQDYVLSREGTPRGIVAQASAYSREELLNKVRGLVTAYARHKAARDTAQVSSP
jgi:hypothetical protein